jgi:hypothetical protein
VIALCGKLIVAYGRFESYVDSQGVIAMPVAQGVGHVVLTVTDVPRSSGFYDRLFDGQAVVTIEPRAGYRE